MSTVTLERFALSEVEAKSFGTRLKAMRERAGLSRAQFGEAMEVDKRVVESWEQGLRTPKTLELPRIIEIIDCTYDELFTEPTKAELKANKRGRPRKDE